MKTEWRFNGTAQLILIPENARDKAMIQLAFDGRPELRLKPTAGEETIIEATAPKPQSRDPKWCYECDRSLADCAGTVECLTAVQQQLERQSA